MPTCPSNAKPKHRASGYRCMQAVRLLSLHRTAPVILRFLRRPVLQMYSYAYIRADSKRGKRSKTRAAGTKLFIIETLLSRAVRLINARKKLPAKLTDSKTGVASTGKPPEAFCEPYLLRERDGRQYHILGRRVSIPGFSEDCFLRFPNAVVSKVKPSSI